MVRYSYSVPVFVGPEIDDLFSIYIPDLLLYVFKSTTLSN